MQLISNAALKSIIIVVRFYQIVFSRIKLPCCRYYPTCSTYFIQAVQRYKFKGIWIGTKRILSCHPFNSGGIDELK
ncbi:MAG: membrane protein insertion efficiency factor YidD [Candidatus Margulisiibacteriota bacterium]